MFLASILYLPVVLVAILVKFNEISIRKMSGHLNLSSDPGFCIHLGNFFKS